MEFCFVLFWGQGDLFPGKSKFQWRDKILWNVSFYLDEICSHIWQESFFFFWQFLTNPSRVSRLHSLCTLWKVIYRLCNWTLSTVKFLYILQGLMQDWSLISDAFINYKYNQGVFSGTIKHLVKEDKGITAAAWVYCVCFSQCAAILPSIHVSQKQ